MLLLIKRLTQSQPNFSQIIMFTTLGAGHIIGAQKSLWSCLMREKINKWIKYLQGCICCESIKTHLLQKFYLCCTPVSLWEILLSGFLSHPSPPVDSIWVVVSPTITEESQLIEEEKSKFRNQSLFKARHLHSMLPIKIPSPGSSFCGPVVNEPD